MRGYPYRSYFPNGKELAKHASLGHGNRWVQVDTAVNGDATPIITVSENEFTPKDGDPVSLALHYDGKLFAHTRHDPITHQHVYTQVASVLPVVADVQEGAERLEVAGTIGKGTRGVSAFGNHTANNWPNGGDGSGVETRVDTFHNN